MVKKHIVSPPSLERTSNEGYVEVMFAKSLDEATGCRSYLEEQRIPALIEQVRRGRAGIGVAVLVPENRLVEASEYLAARDQEEEEEEFDDELEDEEFDDEFDDDDEYDDDDYEDDDDDDSDDDDEEYEDDYEDDDDV